MQRVKRRKFSPSYVVLLAMINDDNADTETLMRCSVFVALTTLVLHSQIPAKESLWGIVTQISTTSTALLLENISESVRARLEARNAANDTRLRDTLAFYAIRYLLASKTCILDLWYGWQKGDPNVQKDEMVRSFLRESLWLELPLRKEFLKVLQQNGLELSKISGDEQYDVGEPFSEQELSAVIGIGCRQIPTRVSMRYFASSSNNHDTNMERVISALRKTCPIMRRTDHILNDGFTDGETVFSVLGKVGSNMNRMFSNGMGNLDESICRRVSMEISRCVTGSIPAEVDDVLWHFSTGEVLGFPDAELRSYCVTCFHLLLVARSENPGLDFRPFISQLTDKIANMSTLPSIPVKEETKDDSGDEQHFDEENTNGQTGSVKDATQALLSPTLQVIAQADPRSSSPPRQEMSTVTRVRSVSPVRAPPFLFAGEDADPPVATGEPVQHQSSAGGVPKGNTNNSSGSVYKDLQHASSTLYRPETIAPSGASHRFNSSSNLLGPHQSSSVKQSISHEESTGADQSMTQHHSVGHQRSTGAHHPMTQNHSTRQHQSISPHQSGNAYGSASHQRSTPRHQSSANHGTYQRGFRDNPHHSSGQNWKEFFGHASGHVPLERKEVQATNGLTTESQVVHKMNANDYDVRQGLNSRLAVSPEFQRATGMSNETDQPAVRIIMNPPAPRAPRAVIQQAYAKRSPSGGRPLLGSWSPSARRVNRAGIGDLRNDLAPYPRMGSAQQNEALPDRLMRSGQSPQADFVQRMTGHSPQVPSPQNYLGFQAVYSGVPHLSTAAAAQLFQREQRQHNHVPQLGIGGPRATSRPTSLDRAAGGLTVAYDGNQQECLTVTREFLETLPANTHVGRSPDGSPPQPSLQVGFEPVQAADGTILVQDSLSTRLLQIRHTDSGANGKQTAQLLSPSDQLRVMTDGLARSPTEMSSIHEKYMLNSRLPSTTAIRPGTLRVADGRESLRLQSLRSPYYESEGRSSLSRSAQGVDGSFRVGALREQTYHVDPTVGMSKPMSSVYAGSPEQSACYYSFGPASVRGVASAVYGPPRTVYEQQTTPRGGTPRGPSALSLTPHLDALSLALGMHGSPDDYASPSGIGNGMPHDHATSPLLHPATTKSIIGGQTSSRLAGGILTSSLAVCSPGEGGEQFGGFPYASTSLALPEGKASEVPGKITIPGGVPYSLPNDKSFPSAIPEGIPNISGKYAGFRIVEGVAQVPFDAEYDALAERVSELISQHLTGPVILELHKAQIMLRERNLSQDFRIMGTQIQLGIQMGAEQQTAQEARSISMSSSGSTKKSTRSAAATEEVQDDAVSNAMRERGDSPPVQSTLTALQSAPVENTLGESVPVARSTTRVSKRSSYVVSLDNRVPKRVSVPLKVQHVDLDQMQEEVVQTLDSGLEAREKTPDPSKTSSGRRTAYSKIKGVAATPTAIRKLGKESAKPNKSFARGLSIKEEKRISVKRRSVTVETPAEEQKWFPDSHFPTKKETAKHVTGAPEGFYDQFEPGTPANFNNHRDPDVPQSVPEIRKSRKSDANPAATVADFAIRSIRASGRVSHDLTSFSRKVLNLVEQYPDTRPGNRELFTDEVMGNVKSSIKALHAFAKQELALFDKQYDNLLDAEKELYTVYRKTQRLRSDVLNIVPATFEIFESGRHPSEPLGKLLKKAKRANDVTKCVMEWDDVLQYAMEHVQLTKQDLAKDIDAILRVFQMDDDDYEDLEADVAHFYRKVLNMYDPNDREHLITEAINSDILYQHASMQEEPRIERKGSLNLSLRNLYSDMCARETFLQECSGEVAARFQRSHEAVVHSIKCLAVLMEILHNGDNAPKRSIMDQYVTRLWAGDDQIGTVFKEFELLREKHQNTKALDDATSALLQHRRQMNVDGRVQEEYGARKVKHEFDAKYKALSDAYTSKLEMVFGAAQTREPKRPKPSAMVRQRTPEVTIEPEEPRSSQIEPPPVEEPKSLVEIKNEVAKRMSSITQAFPNPKKTVVRKTVKKKAVKKKASSTALASSPALSSPAAHPDLRLLDVDDWVENTQFATMEWHEAFITMLGPYIEDTGWDQGGRLRRFFFPFVHDPLVKKITMDVHFAAQQKPEYLDKEATLRLVLDMLQRLFHNMNEHYDHGVLEDSTREDGGYDMGWAASDDVWHSTAEHDLVKVTLGHLLILASKRFHFGIIKARLSAPQRSQAITDLAKLLSVHVIRVFGPVAAPYGERERHAAKAHKHEAVNWVKELKNDLVKPTESYP